jgi:hypothetical protein
VCLALSSLALLAFAAPAAQARTLFDIGQATYAVDNADAATVQMSHLPTWLQVAGAPVLLYAADTGSNSALASGQRLPRNTFLRVLGGGTSRLQVETYDEYGSGLGLRGWVDPGDVLPSAPGTDWRVASKATSLWRSPDADADPLRALDIFTPLQLLDGPVQNRILVRVYRSDFSVLDQGWMDLADSGPALPPQTRVPAPYSDNGTGLRGAFGANQQQAFLDSTAQAARAAALQTGVPASVTVAQAILESDWGRSLLAQDANNYFGIKAIGSLGSDGVVWMPTSEYDSSGQLYQTISAFRAYKSLVDSMTDHDRLLQTASRYAPAMRVSNDPRQFAARLYEGGYSTDPAYADKLVALMDRYDLYRLDG